MQVFSVGCKPMTSTASDTNVVADLKAAGFTDARAEAVMRQFHLAAFATKLELAEARVDIFRWMAVGAMVLQTVVVAGAVAIFLR